MLDIYEAATVEHLDAIRWLMGQYVKWHYQRHARHRKLIDRYFDRRSFEAELADLPGDFARPRGRLLLASAGGQPFGSVALRDLGAGVCEMKRMFVAPEAQGQGLGRALVTRLISEAGAIGYRVMRLDTGPRQHEAHRLYESVGFARIAPYYDLDPEMRDWLIFMELDLGIPMGPNTLFETFEPV